MNTTTVCRRRPKKVQITLADESLPIRRYRPSVPAIVLEALPARLAVRSERHWIRDTNHTAADQPCAASRQGNRDAEATILNSSLKRDHRQHGGDETTFEHAHVQLAKQDTQQKLQELRTKTCGAEEDGGQEQNRSLTFESLQTDALPCPHEFVSTHWRLMYSLKGGSDVENCQR